MCVRARRACTVFVCICECRYLCGPNVCGGQNNLRNWSSPSTLEYFCLLQLPIPALKHTLVQIVLQASSIIQKPITLHSSNTEEMSKLSASVHIPVSLGAGGFPALGACDPCPPLWTSVEYNLTLLRVQACG